MSTAPLLETPRLILRGHRRDDFGAVADLWADEAVTRFFGGTPFSREASWSRLLRYVGHWSVMGFGYWAIEARENGRFIGECGLANFQRDMQPSLGDAAEAGWALNAAEHGKGYATEAVSRILAWADENGMDRAVCIISPGNLGSIRVARKVGFEERGPGSYQGRETLVFERSRPGSPRAEAALIEADPALARSKPR